MLDGSDKNTFYSLRLLRDVVDKRQKPLIIWAGAGVSAWCGFPSWKETAEHFHGCFRKFEPEYDCQRAILLLQEQKLPEVFEICRVTNPQRYNRELASLFTSRIPTPVYHRFINVISKITPLRIITTNIDENLERNLPGVATVQRSDLERCMDLVSSGDAFVAKLHGSASSVESTVFSARDYQNLATNASYLKALETLFALATVVFIGYGLREKYILDLLEANCGTRPLFGTGPHFLVQSSESPALPESVKTIRYLSEPYADHRSAITVLDIISLVESSGHVWFLPKDESPRSTEHPISGYFISDVIPPGTWTSSQSLQAKHQEGDLEFNLIVGQGFEQSELPDTTSHAMQDLVVGLVSFDFLYFPLSCASKLHDLFGEGTFWNLVSTGVFRFIYFSQEPCMGFRSFDAVDGGDILSITSHAKSGEPNTIDDQIRKQFHGRPGREAQAEQLFETLKRAVSTFDHEKFNIPSLTRGALLHPSVRRLLGISDAVLPTSIPRWAKFPVIRLAHTITAGCACESFRLPATKIGYGGDVLVGAAFAVSAARDWADSISSYVLAEGFNADLGGYVQSNPSVLTALLDFRDSQAGVDLRREVLHELATNEGAEFVASVNAGLRGLVPTAIMENARNKFSGLLVRNSRDTTVVPAVWTNTRNSDSITSLWRARSGRELQQHCRSMGIRLRSLCPCGSGETLQLCCAKALWTDRSGRIRRDLADL